MSDTTPAFLEGEVGGRKQRFALTAVCRMGRNESNELVVPDESVSRNHAILHRSGAGIYHINDMGSSNGTFVNGARVTAPVMLRDGDFITVGSCKFQFQQPRPEPVTEPRGNFAATSIVITQKAITVLVADIQGFTSLAQRVDANTLSLVTGAFFRESGRLLQESGAWGQKYIGDAVMAVWTPPAEPGLRDALVALEVLCRMALVAEGLQERFGLSEPIRIGGGINSGMASLGNVGSVAAADHTALGDAVNRAFRLEAMTRVIKHDIILGESTYGLIASQPDLTRVFKPFTLDLKGYTTPVAAHATNFNELAQALKGSQLGLGSRGMAR